MSKQIKIVATREVTDCEALLINAASYQGSEAFGGAFQVWDLDDCCWTDADTGQLVVEVICQSPEDMSEDATLLLTLHDPMPEGCSGYQGDVVARLEFA